MPSRVAAASITLLIGVMLLPLASASAAGPDRLSKEDRLLVTKARQEGQKLVTVLIATQPVAGSRVASGIAALGGTVRYRLDEVKYIRAQVPTDNVEKVGGLAGVLAFEVDKLIPLPDVRVDPEGQVNPTPQTPPGPATPRNNPYMPIGDTGAAQFLDAHPTWDGRGVTIGIVDTGISLDHPSLLTTSTGERKIIQWVTGTDPVTDNDPTWINMAAQVSGASFAHGGFTWTAPAAGNYRIGIFNEADPRFGGTGSEYAIQCTAGPPATFGGDLNRDGVCAQKFGLLWNTASNQVWVDTDLDRSFADEAAMTDYAVNYDVGWFGTDNAATPVAERVPFTVETNGKAKYVNLGIVSAAHGSHVAGIAAGHSLFGGAMSGAAPGAKIVSSRACLFVAGCTGHALFEGMIYVAKQGDADVINMSIGGLPSLNDGNNARAILYDNLIETYNVQMFISAGNSGPGANTVGDPSVATKVMSIAAYITDATWESNYGSTAPAAGTDNLHPFSSRGPREDGGFKPSLAAPGAAVSSTPLWQPGGPVAGTYALPPGYSMFNGTSMAAPESTGAAALLVSAAKQAGAQHQPAQIRQALTSSARFLEGIGAYEQGNGLIRVGAAWDLLRTNIKTVDIRSSVPSGSILASFLATPGVGTGIYDRENTVLGTAYTRQYTFRRTSGGGGSKTYNLTWVGNDETFSSAGSIALPLNGNVGLTVNINPTTPGAHSTILNLDDPSTVGIDYQTLNTVIVPYTFTAGNDYTQTFTGSVARNQALSYFFKVPTGTPAFKVDFSGPTATPGTGQARFLRFHPFGVGIDSNTSTVCYSPPVTPGGTCPGGGPNSRTAANPQAGVWEVTVEARRTSDVAFTPFSLTASILGASVSPNPDVISSATIGTPIARSYTATNLFGAFIGRMEGTPLGSARLGRPFNIAHHALQSYHTVIPAGATSFRATIGSPSDPAADLDLFVYLCATETTPTASCTLKGQNADGDSEESVTIQGAALTPGLYRVVVDGFNVPAGTTDYNYVDVFFKTPTFGTISVTDANALRPAQPAAGSTWTAPGSILVNEAPDAGRVLFGNVQVRTDTNVLVGQNEVVVQNVTPAP